MPHGNAIIEDPDTKKLTTEKDPDEVLDYPFDWRDHLTALGNDTIISHTIVIDNQGAATALVIGALGSSHTLSPGYVIVWLAAGTLGAKHKVTCRVVTAGGRTIDKLLTVKIKEN